MSDNLERDDATQSDLDKALSVVVEFSGGLEILFSDQRKHRIHLPAKDEEGNKANVAFLVRYLCAHVMDDRREELFVLDDTVRPGILVLINDADWELEGEGRYELKKDDNILFVSTLHGG